MKEPVYMFENYCPEAGIALGMAKILASLVEEGILTVSEAARRSGVTEEEFKKYL
ncbi:MAG: hypothetical protein MJ059_00550 [Lachnospiraceae bacterium]|nr:hypothetical protein [Lachnospiraceae bacterium]